MHTILILPMYTILSPLFGIFVSRNLMYNTSAMKNKLNRIILRNFSPLIKNVNVLIKEITAEI